MENTFTDEPIQIGIAQLPKLAENQQDGTLVDLIKHLNQFYFNDTISIQVLPFARSFAALANDKTDVHLPIIYDADVAGSDNLLLPDHSELALSDLLFSEQTLFKVPFVILSHKDM